MNNKKETFFIFGAPRSATTAYTKIFNLASNAYVFVEQQPKMGYEARECYLGHMDDPKSFIYSSKNEHISLIHDLNKHYGDKNQNYLVFLPFMFEVWPDSKYIFLYRDGRDVVTSQMNFQANPKYKNNIYGMTEDEKESKINNPVQDLWDYARLRPVKGEKYYDNWKIISRFEKICWYWTKYNELALKYLENLEPERYMAINVSKKNIEDIERAFDLLKLNNFNKENINDMLNAKINTSLDSKSFVPFPKWENWHERNKIVFDKYCTMMMRRLGYF